MKKEYYDKKSFNKILSKVDKKSRAMPRVKKLMKEIDVLSKRAEPGSTADKKKGIAIQIKVKLDAIAAEIMSVGNDFKNGQDIQKISNTSASEIKENKGKGMKLIDRLVNEYTEPEIINEARKTRAEYYQDYRNDKHYSPLISDSDYVVIAGKGKTTVEVPWVAYNDPKKDQNKRKHKYYKNQFGIDITGEHYDAEQGKKIKLLYNKNGWPSDIKDTSFDSQEHDDTDFEFTADHFIIIDGEALLQLNVYGRPAYGFGAIYDFKKKFGREPEAGDREWVETWRKLGFKRDQAEWRKHSGNPELTPKQIKLGLSPSQSGFAGEKYYKFTKEIYDRDYDPRPIITVRTTRFDNGDDVMAKITGERRDIMDFLSSEEYKTDYMVPSRSPGWRYLGSFPAKIQKQLKMKVYKKNSKQFKDWRANKISYTELQK